MSQLPDNVVELKFLICEQLSAPEETVTEALQRLKPSTPLKPNAKQALSKEFEQLTNLSLKLSQMGEYEIYEQSKQEILQQLDNYRKPMQWQFKWDNKDDAEIHGPYSTEMMQSWLQYGQFAGYDVQVRQVQQDNIAKPVADEDIDIFAADNTTANSASQQGTTHLFVPLQSISFIRFK